MRMTKESQILDLSANLSHHIEAFNLLSIEYLHSHLMSGEFMDAN